MSSIVPAKPNLANPVSLPAIGSAPTVAHQTSANVVSTPPISGAGEEITAEFLAKRFKSTAVSFADVVEHSVKERMKLYAPVLQPSALINQLIKDGIREYETKTGNSTGLTPDRRIDVEYQPDVPHNPNLHITAPVRKTRRFTLAQVVTGAYQHEIRALRGPAGIRYKVVSHEFQPLIDHLTRSNLQTKMLDALRAYQADPAKQRGMTELYKSEVIHRCLAYIVKADPKSREYAAVADFLSGKLQAREVKLHGATVNGAFLIPVKEGGILFSVDDPQYFEIGTQTNHYKKFGADISEQVPVYPTSDAFKQWVAGKLPVYEQLRHEGKSDTYDLKKRSRSSMPSLGIGVTEGQVYFNPFSFHATPSLDALTERLYTGSMQRLEKDIDSLVFTDGERHTLHALDVSKAILDLYAMMASASGVGSRFFSFMTILALESAKLGAGLMQSHISDRPSEAEAYLKDAIGSAAMAGAFLAIPLTGAFAKGVRYPFKSIPQALSYYRFVNGQVQKKMPGIVKGLLKNVFKRPSAPSTSGAAAKSARKPPLQMRRASVGGSTPITPTTKSPLSQLDQSRQAIERSLPVARQRLDAAIRTAADPNYVQDTRQLARLFYGSDSPETLNALKRKQQLMKADLGALKTENIDFLQNESPGWSAQLQPSNYADYKGGAINTKYIEVNVDGAMGYYRDMGSSDETLANTLIHEMGHGMPADEDYVYAGKLSGAREDIVDLLNLGHSKNPKDFRYLSQDAEDGTVSLFARDPQKHNADSTLFITALLDQAMSNRPLFEANIAAINLAIARAGGNLINETVAVRIISKRSVPAPSAPAFLLARHDQTGRIVGVFEKVPKEGTEPVTLLDAVRSVFKWR